MRIYGIVGSLSKDGNVGLLASQALQSTQSRGSKVEKAYLNDMKIMPFQDCSKDPYPKFCFFEDDGARISSLLETCGA